MGGEGSCSYLYDTPAIVQRNVSFDGSTIALEQTFSYSTTWYTSSGNGDYWTARQATVTTTDEITGKTWKTAYSYVPITLSAPPNLFTGSSYFLDQTSVEQTVTYYGYSPSYPTLRTVNKNWFDQFKLACQFVTLDNGAVAGSFYTYGAGAVVTDHKEYDYGQLAASSCLNSTTAPSSPTPLRETSTTYQSFAATPIYTSSPSILNQPSTVITYGSGSRAAETDYSYDQYSTSSASATEHDETNYGPSSTAPRGNATTSTKQCFPSCSNPVTTYKYDETGQRLSMTDPCGNGTCSDMTGSSHTTTYSYTDSYTPCSGTAPPSGATNAYLTKVTYPQTGSVNHIVSYCHDYVKGLMLSSTDENSQTTTYAYADSLDRLTQASYPDGGQTTYSYNDTPPSPTQTATKKLNSSQSVTTVSTMNGLGAVIETQLTSDPQGTITTLKVLDGMGRDYKVYNPYRSTSDPTYGYTTYVYDALGRTTSVTKQDSSVVTTQYCGQETLVTDEASHWRRSKTDGLGRLIEVDEPNSTTATVNVCPGTGEPIWVTTYTNDTLNNLTAVVQGGSHNRSFVYDSLKHLMQSTNPESGTICYGTLSGSTANRTATT